MVEEFIPIASFIATVLIVAVIMYFKYKTRSAVQETIRLAMEKGTELSGELIEQISEPKKSTATDLRRGLISIAIGVGFALFGAILGEEDAARPMLAIGMFPTLVGIAYLILWRTGDREQQS